MLRQVPDGRWVDRLCPADLLHYHGRALEGRLDEMRFDLAVASSAAKLQFDKGESLQALSKALGNRTGDSAPPRQTFGAALAARRGKGGDAA